jgi:GDP/UDP-N,N'-diacetylbacillosamine 2-epimerase (hydrolysing)
MASKKTVCIVTGTRAEYGLLKPLIQQLLPDESIKLCIVATGTHLSPDFGETYREIEDDGFFIDAKIKIPLASDTHGGMARATGSALISFADYFEKNPPSLLVVLGDRFEMLSAAIAASMQNIPIAHISGGDTSEGAMDEFIRHSITKMSFLHFPTNEQSRKRIIQLGELPERVFNVGALNVDNILSLPLLSAEELSESLDFDLRGNYALVTFHPETIQDNINTNGLRELLTSVDNFPNLNWLFTKSNADAGGRKINLLLDDFCENRKNCAVFDSLGSVRYLSAIKHAAFVAGNSSSGLYETPSFGIPCVNIGERQRGRLRSENVIDCPLLTDAITNAVKKALSLDFRNIARNTSNPFGDGSAAKKISKEINRFLQCENISLKKEFYMQ